MTRIIPVAMLMLFCAGCTVSLQATSRLAEPTGTVLSAEDVAAVQQLKAEHQRMMTGIAGMEADLAGVPDDLDALKAVLKKYGFAVGDD